MGSKLSVVASSALVVLCCVAVAGCSHEASVVAVNGVVVFPDGTPLAGGTIEFRSIEKSTSAKPNIASGTIEADGKFKLATAKGGDGAAPGEYRVAIAPLLPDDPGTIPVKQRRRAMEPIDRKYSDFDTSNLRYTVTDDPANNHFHIEVTRPR